MTKTFRIVMAAIGAAVVVPMVFALSLESSQPIIRARTVASHTPVSAVVMTKTVVSSSSLAQVAGVSKSAKPDSAADVAKLIVVGAALFGLAAAVKRST